MIIVIDALNRDRFEDLIDEMHRLRARVFGDRLGWVTDIQDGREVDEFDALDPTYLVGLDDDGQVVSCARLLQTTGPHMLGDVFSCLLDGEPPLRSSRVWEVSRFCVDTERLGVRGAAGVSRATCELLIAGNDYAVMAGVSDIVARHRPGDGPHPEAFGLPAPTTTWARASRWARSTPLAALTACTEQRGQAVRAFAGIEGSVFLEEDEALELFSRNSAGLSASNVVPFPVARAAGTEVGTAEVLSYCIAMIRAAEGEEERRQASRVARELLVGVGLAEDVESLARALSAPAEAAGP